MRKILAILALVSAAGCAPQTPLQCQPGPDFAGFYCEPGAYLPRREIDGACAGTVFCRSDGVAACNDTPQGAVPTADHFHRLVCTNGTVSDVGPF